MKILHIIPGMANASGPSQFIYQATDHQIQLGHDVSVCYVKGRGTDAQVEKLPSKLTLNAFSTPFLKSWAFSPRLLWFLLSNLGHYDIVHIHSIWTFTNLAFAIANIFHSRPYVVKPAGSFERWAMGVKAGKKRWYLKFIELPILNKAKVIQATSVKEEETFKDYSFFSRVQVIPNGVEPALDSTRLSNLIQERKNKDQIQILFLGRIAPVKNLNFLLEVANLVKDHVPAHKWKLVIAGPIKDDYSRSVKRSYHSEAEFDFSFVGEVDGQAKRDLFLSSDLYILPSLSENFAISVAEALSFALPVITSDQTPWQSINENAAGACLPLEKDHFCKVLVELLKNKEKRIISSQNAFSLAQSFYWNSIVNQLERAYWS